MRKAEVVIGGVYKAKISGRIVEVKILAVHNFGGWHARNLETGRAVRIKSAMKLRERVR